MATTIRPVDYHDARQSADLLDLLDHYARDPMGGNTPLPDATRAHLIPQLQQRPTFDSAIAYVDGQPAALVNFAEGFSTFAARPLINVHDLVVHTEYRGRGLSRQLLEYVEREAARRGCCKLTLEVLSENRVAISAYASYGFKPYQLTDDGGPAQFWEKPLQPSTD